MNNELKFIDIIGVLSFYIALQNLQENEKQSNLLKNKLDEQDNIYLKEIIKQNKEILSLLKDRR